MTSHSPSTSSSEEGPPPRPNRWPSAPSTWLSITQAERAEAESLDKLRDRDLSLHLMAAWQLKKRAERLDKPGSEKLDGVHSDAKDQWVPPRTWTAWPLPVDEVPREDEDGWGPYAGGDEDDVYRRVHMEDGLSKELKECLFGLMLKEARERWEQREWDEDEEEEDMGEHDARIDRSEDEAAATKEHDTSSAASAASLKTIYKPVVSTDDEKSRLLLQPRINHTLARLDALLLALHNARSPWKRTERQVRGDSHNFASSRSSSPVGDVDEGSENEPAQKRGRGRPMKYAPRPPEQSQGRSSEQESDSEDQHEGQWRAKMTHRGRPLKQYPRLGDETKEEYSVRVARLQKKAIPSFAQPRSQTSRTLASKSQSRSRPAGMTSLPFRQAPSTQDKKRVSRHKLGLRGWSEVFGMAAIIGFDSVALERATKRCVEIFGEGMDYLVLPESAAAAKADKLVSYQIGMIPPLGALGESGDEGSSFSSSGRQIKKQRIDACPVPGCDRKGKPFSGRGGTKQKLEKHLKVVHEMGLDNIEYLVPASDEEMSGCVHVDRWLRPVSKKRGQRGKDLGRRKAGRWAGTEQKGSSDATQKEQRQDEDEDEDEDEDGHDGRSWSSMDATDDERDEHEEEVVIEEQSESSDVEVDISAMKSGSEDTSISSESE